MNRLVVEWSAVRRIYLVILRWEALFFAGALLIATVAARALHLGLFGYLLVLPLVIAGPPFALRKALQREYAGFRLVAIEREGMREARISRAAWRDARELNELLGLPPEPEPDLNADRPEVEVPLDRERCWRIYLVSQFWEGVLCYGVMFVLALPYAILSRITPAAWDGPVMVVSTILWADVVVAASFWSLRRALEHVYPDFRLGLVSAEAGAVEPVGEVSLSAPT